MPIASLKPFLEDARKNKYCLGCFNVFNVETLEGAVEAAVNLQTPVVCAVYEPQLKYSDLETFSNLVKDVSNKVNVPLILHLDHATEISSIINAIKCGFTSLMYDGPVGLSFEEKIEKTRQFVDIVHSVGLIAEAEVGYITRAGIDEGGAEANLTNAKSAVEFVEKTGVDVLAPAIGSIHGLTEQRAAINMEMLTKIRQMTDCYLSLHGGSGVDDTQIGAAIDLGINKASVYTKISTVAVNKLKELLSKDSPDLAVLLNEVRNGYREMIEDRLKAFRSVNICSFQSNVCQLTTSPSYSSKEILAKKTQSGDSFFKQSGHASNYDNIVQEITDRVLKMLKGN
ncbi:MAG: class II fructose-bisphosphate aldolase [Actinobacteria bacterium]|nr:class II fructose-bisphosphate aldolase [Actinomycetota bacterium]